MASRHRFGRVRRPVHRDARVAIGAWRSALMDACSASNLRPLGWTILRYVTHSNGCAATVLQKDPVSCALMSGLLRDACRWPSWVCAYVSGTNLSGGLEAHGC